MANQGLFGNIWDTQTLQQQDIETQGVNWGNVRNPFAAAAGMGGGMLGRGIGHALGMQTPGEAKQAKMQEIAAQFPDLDPGDPAQLRQVQSALWQGGLYDASAKVGDMIKEDKTTATHQNNMAKAKALVDEHGGDIRTAFNYVVTHPTGQVAFDLGAGYERFLGGGDASVEVGEVQEWSADETIPVTSSPPTIEELMAERERLANSGIGAPPQDKASIALQVESVEYQQKSVEKTLDRLERYSKDNVFPIRNELNNISDVETFWNESVQGNIAAKNRLKTALTKMGGDNRVGIQEVQTALGGGDILERLFRGANDLFSGDLTEKDASDVKRIIDALNAKYREKMADAVDRGRGAYSGVVAPQYLDAYLPRTSGTQTSSSPEERAAAIEELRRRGVLPR